MKTIPGKKGFKFAVFAALALILAGVGTVYFTTFKWVSVYVDDEIHRRFTTATTVQDVLDEMGLELRSEDYVYPSREDNLQRQTGIAVVKAKPYTVSHDGKNTEVWSVGNKVADILADAEVTWQGQDIVLPAAESSPPGDSNIAVVRVTSDVVHQELTLPHSVMRVPNSSLYRGQERVVQNGADGSQVNTIQVTYHDDEEIERVQIDSEVTEPAIDTIVEYGTISSISRGGYRIGIRGVLDVRATAYCSGAEGSGCPLDKNGHSVCTGKYNSGYTSTGRPARQGKGTREQPYIIAVDPRSIPLNSLVYLSFNGGRVVTRDGEVITDGFAIAADVGSAIKGNRIDILFDKHWVAYYFGHRSVRVFIVDSVEQQ